jgi:hypothetical protein
MSSGERSGAISPVQEYAGGASAPAQWMAWIPLVLGGKDTVAKFEVFLESKKGEKAGKRPWAVYTVLTISTESIGEVQWNIHLIEKQLSLSVFAPEADRSALEKMILGIESSLLGRGYVLSGKTIYLERPFRMPQGSYPNWLG